MDLYEGDNRKHLRRLIDDGVWVHSVVTDPPYGLTSVQKRFGAEDAAPAKFGTDGAFARASAGFMGSKWDGTGIERDPEFWRLIHDILLPGGYVVAFASSRTFARMAVAIEDAGFITHPMLGWVTGQGFPKAHNAAMAIDKALGVPGSPEAAQWEGWAYGAQALKPALEPIYVGQKPFDGKTGAPSIIKWGVGALNIDGCRVPSETGRPLIISDRRSGNNTYADGLQGSVSAGMTDLGRHPANLLHDGSDEVVALFPQSAGQLARVGPEHGSRETKHCYGDYGPRPDTPPRNDTGSAARFFHAFPPDEPYPVYYRPKAGKADRAGSKHPTVKPIALMRWLCRLITPPGGTVLDPFAGSGTTGSAALAEDFSPLLIEGDPTFARDIRRRFGVETVSDKLARLAEAMS